MPSLLFMATKSSVRFSRAMTIATVESQRGIGWTSWMTTRRPASVDSVVTSAVLPPSDLGRTGAINGARKTMMARAPALMAPEAIPDRSPRSKTMGRKTRAT